jgi:hypothetical protein
MNRTTFRNYTNLNIKSLIILSSLLVIIGCGREDKEKQRAIAVAKAQLELARTKGSLEETFLALKTIETLGGVGDYTTNEIENTKRAIGLLNTLRIAKGEHRHEDVVHVASDLLELFPDNTEARKDLKESGLILNYLESAINFRKKCFESDAKGGVTLVKEKTEEKDKAKWDLDAIAFNLKNSREQVEEALKLDPQYVEAVSIKQSIRQMQNTVGMLIANSIFAEVDSVRPLISKFFNLFHSGMVSAVESSYDSPTKYWERSESTREKVASSLTIINKGIASRAAFLSQIDPPDIQNMTKAAIQAAALISRLQSTLLNPRGNLNDYKSDYLLVDSEYSRLVDNYQTLKSNSEAVISDLVGFVKTLVDSNLYKKPEETKKLLKKHEKLINQA